MSREEKAFILASIEIKAKNEEEQQKKLKAKRPHKK